MHGSNHVSLIAWIMYVAGLSFSHPSLAAKTDVVELLNGDRITGEVRSLDRGMLTFSTDHMGTLEIEWEYVKRLQSRQVLDVELQSGQRFFGSLATASEPGQLLLESTAKTEHAVAMEDTVKMTPLEETGHLLQRSDGYVDLGYSSTKSTDVIQWNLGAGMTFRDRVRLWDFNYSQTLSDSGTTENTTASLTGELRRFFGNRWFWSGSLQFTRNDAQGVDLRSLIGGAIGRNLVQTNHQLLSLGAGLGYSRGGPVRWHGADQYRSHPGA